MRCGRRVACAGAGGSSWIPAVPAAASKSLGAVWRRTRAASGRRPSSRGGTCRPRSRGGARAEPERAVAGTCRRWTAEAEKTHNPPAALRLSRAEQAYRRSCLEEGSYASFDGRPSTASARNAMLQAAWKQFSASRSSYFRRAPRREKSPRERSTTFLTQGGGLALAPG